jgi:hypothetical protein
MNKLKIKPCGKQSGIKILFKRNKKLSPYCVKAKPESLCALVQTGDCSIECEGNTVWMCHNYVLRAIDHLEDYPWWKRIYIKHIYNKYLKDLNKIRSIYTQMEFLEEMEKW